MKFTILPVLAAGVVFGLSAASWSGELGKAMPNNYYDGVAAKLYGAGYRDVRLVDQDVQLLSAYDGDGSEVMIVVGKVHRNVLSVTYVHDGDE